MKVKITKTIDMHQIPSEARKMLDQTKNNLVHGLPDKMNNVCMHALSSQGETFFKAIELIDSFRQELASFDESLQEVQNILVGYKKAMMPEPEPEEPHSEAEYEKLMSQMDGSDEGGDTDYGEYGEHYGNENEEW